MVPLCRHILPSNKRCDSPAVRGQLYCYHHKVVKIATTRPPRKPYDATYIIPFVFCEDRAAVQLNLHLVNRALNEGRIDTRTANAYNNSFRIALSNLRLGPLAEQDTDNSIRRVILTPEGDEIAPPREKLEKDESPIHYKDCPCQRCAEQFRGAAPEQHHADCQCGLCEPITQDCHPEAQRSAAEEPASCEPATAMGAPSLEPTATKVGNHESSSNDQEGAKRGCLDGQSRSASAHALRSADTLNPIQKEPDYHDYLYGDDIAKHEAQHAARARAALQAGLEPPEYTPWDTSIKTAEYEREHQEWKDGIDQRRKAAIDKWNADHPEAPEEFKPFLTWGEEHDLKLAEMKRLREQEEARLREQSQATSLAMQSKT